MVNLLVISDSHGRREKIKEVIRRQFVLEDKYRPTHIVHLGDGVEDVERCEEAKQFCIHAVRGNCDNFFYSNTYPDELLFDLFGYKIFMTHGHTYSVKCSDVQVVKRALECKADVLLYGHTHNFVSYTLEKGDSIGELVLDKPLAVFNPGSLGFGGTFGVITLSEDGVVCSNGILN